MNKTEIKKILKPLIKECIKEVLLEEKGTLSHIISEVTNGLSASPQKTKLFEQVETAQSNAKEQQRKLFENKKKLLDAIGKDSYGGVNLFEGTTPAPGHGASDHGPLSGVSAHDPGVNISNIVSGKSAAIFKRMMEKK